MKLVLLEERKVDCSFPLINVIECQLILILLVIIREGIIYLLLNNCYKKGIFTM